MDPEVRAELYLALMLLGADPMLLAAVESMDGRELAAYLRTWNETRVLEMKEWLPTTSGEDLAAAEQRIAQYESHHPLKKAA